MAQFRFKLETVLKHRRIIEEERQRDLATAMRHRMILMEQLRSIQQEISRSKGDLAKTLVGRVDLDRVGDFTRYSSQSTQRAQQIVLALAQVEKQVQQARQKLIQATTARKAMELLRDRYFALWQQEADKRETATLDELAVGAFARRLAGQEI